MNTPSSIYVERPVEGTIDELWAATQEPDEHARWDLRFSDIEYLPKENGDDPQEFTYRTRVGFGLAVAGTGTSVARRERDGETTSVLEFRSDDPKSLIDEGRGFWRYAEADGDEIRFLTEYDYDTRWGTVGTAVDRFLFRPLLGWATAWSFDALRLWVEEGVTPETSLRTSAVHAVARLTLAFVWAYQGLVPKLAGPHPEEVALFRATLPLVPADPALVALGAAEVLFGLALVACWRTRWLLLAAAAIPALLTVGVATGAPEAFLGPFNPLALNAAMAALGVVGYLASDELPTARNCHRERA